MSVMASPHDCGIDLSHFHDFGTAGYMYDRTSADSSPSPITLFANLDPIACEPFPVFPTMYGSPAATSVTPFVEFTDLTAPYQDDRRRRRSHAVRDEKTISTMHMRRRAQNRASQRAFRERKEKHAQELQQELDKLQAKHQSLLDSYQDLDSTNAKLNAELEHLRAKITTTQSSHRDTLDEILGSDAADPYGFEHGLERDIQSSAEP